MSKKKSSTKDIFLEILGQNFVETPRYPKFRLPELLPAQQQKVDMGQYLLTHNFGGPKPKVDVTKILDKQGASAEEPSFISKIFDTVSAPLYAVTNTIEDWADGEGNPALELGQNIIGGAARIATGMPSPVEKIPGLRNIDRALETIADKYNEPKLFNEILKEQGVTNPVARYGGGFVLDLALDPLTYVPFIGIGKKAKDASRAAAKIGATESDAIAAGFMKSPEKTKTVTREGKTVLGKGEAPPVAKTSAAEAAMKHSGINVPPGYIPKPAGKFKLNLDKTKPIPTPEALGNFDNQYAVNKYVSFNEDSPELEKLLGKFEVPSGSKPLFRGAEDKNLKVGDTFEFKGKSFSTLENDADYFAKHSEWKKQGTKPAIYKIEGGVKGLKPSEFVAFDPAKPSTHMMQETEFLSRSKFRVVNKEVNNEGVVVYTLRAERTDPFTPVDPDMSWGAGDISMRILNDPESLAAMKKAKKSDEGWRNAQKRWGRDPDVEEAALSNAETKAEFYDRMRDFKLKKAGKVYDGKGNISIRSVTEIMEDIQQGKILRFGQEAPSATGPLRDETLKIADDFVTNSLMPTSGMRRIDLNPANQANLYNRMFAATERIIKDNPELSKVYSNVNSERALKVRRLMARSMLRTAEDHMILLKKPPVYWDGTRVRLSDVLEEVGFVANDELATKVMKAFIERDLSRISVPEVGNAINLALARRATHMADILENVTDYANLSKRTIFDTYTTPRAYARLKQLPEDFAKVGDDLGMTPEELNAVKDIVRNVIDVDALPTEKFMFHLGQAMMKANREGRITIQEWDKFNQTILRTVGMTKEKLHKNITGIGIVDTFMTRWTTWFGRGAMKQYAMDVFQYGEMNAALRGRAFRHMAQEHAPEDIIKAFAAAADPTTMGIILSEDPKTLKLSMQILEYFESMLSSSGMRNLVDQQYTPAVLSGMVMEDVNKYLKAQGSTFQFINRKIKDKLTGLPRDYSEKGVGWMSSWEVADPKRLGQNPVHLMFDIDLAIEKTTKEYALVDDFIMRFGFAKGTAGYSSKLHTGTLAHKRVPDGVYFEPKVAQDFQRLLDDLSDMYLPKSKIMRYYARGLRAWKTGVTIYLPSHHIRNMIGDLHLMWWAGHNDPMNFVRARRVLQTQRRYLKGALKQDSFGALNDYTSREAMEWAKTRGGDVIIKQNGVSLTADELYISAHQHGLLPDANKVEDLFGEAPLEFNFRNQRLKEFVARPLGGKAHKVVSDVAEYREHYVRMAHFMGAVNKGLKKSNNVKKVLDDAAHEVRKWHPDGRDLTKWEQEVRMAIPFYSWTRKALPLVVQSLVQRPAKVLYYPKANQALQGLLGVDNTNGMADPFPDNQLSPEWIRAKGIGPIGDTDSENPIGRWFGYLGRNMKGLDGQEKGFTIVDPSNPFSDVAESLFGFGADPLDVGRSIFDQTTPVVKVPGELFVSQKKFSGAPISEREGGEGILAYLAEQVPLLSPAQNVFELGKEPREGATSSRDWQALINYLTALGVRGTKPYEKSAEFEIRERLRNRK